MTIEDNPEQNDQLLLQKRKRDSNPSDTAQQIKRHCTKHSCSTRPSTIITEQQENEINRLMHKVVALTLDNNKLHVELNQLLGKLVQLEQYIVEKDSEVEDLKEAHKDSLIAHLDSCEEAKNNKDGAEKYKLQWNNTRRQVEKKKSAGRNSPAVVNMIG